MQFVGILGGGIRWATAQNAYAQAHPAVYFSSCGLERQQKKSKLDIGCKSKSEQIAQAEVSWRLQWQKGPIWGILRSCGAELPNKISIATSITAPLSLHITNPFIWLLGYFHLSFPGDSAFYDQTKSLKSKLELRSPGYFVLIKTEVAAAGVDLYGMRSFAQTTLFIRQGHESGS